MLPLTLPVREMEKKIAFFKVGGGAEFNTHEVRTKNVCTVTFIRLGKDHGLGLDT